MKPHTDLANMSQAYLYEQLDGTGPNDENQSKTGSMPMFNQPKLNRTPLVTRDTLPPVNMEADRGLWKTTFLLKGPFPCQVPCEKVGRVQGEAVAFLFITLPEPLLNIYQNPRVDWVWAIRLCAIELLQMGVLQWGLQTRQPCPPFAAFGALFAFNSLEKPAGLFPSSSEWHERRQTFTLPPTNIARGHLEDHFPLQGVPYQVPC